MIAGCAWKRVDVASWRPVAIPPPKNSIPPQGGLSVCVYTSTLSFTPNSDHCLQQAYMDEWKGSTNKPCHAASRLAATSTSVHPHCGQWASVFQLEDASACLPVVARMTILGPACGASPVPGPCGCDCPWNKKRSVLHELAPIILSMLLIPPRFILKKLVPGCGIDAIVIPVVEYQSRVA